MENLSGLVAVEDAEAGHVLARVVAGAVVVAGRAGGDVFGLGRHAEVLVEAAAVGRHPLEAPAHAFAEGLELLPGRPRHAEQGHVVVLEVLIGTVDMVGEEGAARATLLPAGAEHEVVDDQGAAAVEQIGQALAPVRPFECIGRVDADPRQRTAFGAEPVALMGEGFLLAQQGLAGLQPFLAGHHRVIVDVHGISPVGGSAHLLVERPREGSTIPSIDSH
ncbi:hypothetical protein D3C79_840700 [compost metagenome]